MENDAQKIEWYENRLGGGRAYVRAAVACFLTQREPACEWRWSVGKHYTKLYIGSFWVVQAHRALTDDEKQALLDMARMRYGS